MVDISGLLEEGQRHATEAAAGAAIGATVGYLSERYDSWDANLPEEVGAASLGTIGADAVTEGVEYAFRNLDVSHSEIIGSDDYAAIVGSTVAGIEYGKGKAQTRELKEEAGELKTWRERLGL